MSKKLSHMPRILDCTLRDGGYVIDFRFTKDEIRNIVLELAESGVPYIEIGHGLGLGAYRRSADKSILSDEEALESAFESKKKSSLGMFFIDGIGEIDDIYKACKMGIDFIRVGTNISTYKNSFKYIDFAKDLGLKVYVNFMKSYTVSKFSLLKYAKKVEARGVDAVYIVDSAGGMLPSEVGDYTRLLYESLDCDIGFHGHNNLMLANANNLTALENGATYVDTTLMGMGRGAGNSSTESMAYILKRMGIDLSIDEKAIVDCANRFIANKVKDKKLNSIDVIGGYARFHSGFYDEFQNVADELGVDVRDLIINVSEINKEDPSSDLIYHEAVKLRRKSTVIFSPKSIKVKKD